MTIEHRCLVCDHPHHANIWSVPVEVEHSSLAVLLAADDASELVDLQPATDHQVRRLYPQIEPGRRLWISQHT